MVPTQEKQNAVSPGGPESASSSDTATTTTESYDIFRHSPVRYLGYANEVGESFRYQFPRFVVPSYMLAFGYCLADAGTSGYDTWHQVKDTSSNPRLDSLASTADVLLWQSLASVAIPGATINMIVRASRWTVARSTARILLPAMVAEWLPTAVGLGSIPVIIHPIDRMVDWFMDSTFRQWSWRSYFLQPSKTEASFQNPGIDVDPKNSAGGAERRD